MLSRFLVVFAVLISCALTGCGDGRPERVPVSGRVMLDGKPLTRGYIRVVPSEARSSGGPIDSNGRFVLGTYEPDDGCVVGTHRVEVCSNEPRGGDLFWYAPKKYANIETSEITVTIAEPTTDLQVDISWSGGRPLLEKGLGGPE